MRRRILNAVWISMVLAMLMIAACDTIGGFGRDVESWAEATDRGIQSYADRVEND